MNFLKLFFGAPFEMIGGIIKQRQQNKAHKLELTQVVQLQRMANAQEGRIAEVAWNQRSMDNSGWRDDFLTILLSLPLVLIFGPDALQAQIADGFEQLQKLPPWYISGIGLMIGSAFGFQKYTNLVMNKAYTLPAVQDVIEDVTDEIAKYTGNGEAL